MSGWRSFRGSLLRVPGAILRGQVHGAADRLVRSAAADVIAHGFVDIGVRGIGFLGKEGGRGHDLPRLAVSALRHVFLHPRSLYRMVTIRREAFDRRDGLARDARYGRRARSHRLAVDVYRARAAEGH